MKLREYEGKALFKKYGISVPASILVSQPGPQSFAAPAVIKAQTLTGNRYAKGGVVIAHSEHDITAAVRTLVGASIDGETVKKVLIEEQIKHEGEYYISFSYDTESRSPVLSISMQGGSGIAHAHVVPIDLSIGLLPFFIRDSLLAAKFSASDSSGLIPVITKLWSLFVQESAIVAEINPLFKTSDGRFIAGDSKIILDGEKYNPNEKRFIDLQGDIAILASGGGASLLNIDTLLVAGGRPANYTEYSGNPPADVVNALTRKVLMRKGLKGCWVIGGTANFTDIYETLRGFLDGLRTIKPKPRFPIVIRRDGPRKEEAFQMLREISEKEGYDFHCYDSHTAMSETADIIVKLAYGDTSKRS